MSLFCLPQPWFSCLVRTVCVAAAVVGLTACAVGPDYQRPDIAVGSEYGALGPDAADSDALNRGWVRAQPQDNALRSDWWALFDDPTLDQMMENLLDTNFDLARAEALYRQAQATLQATRSGCFLQLEHRHLQHVPGRGRVAVVPGFRVVALRISIPYRAPSVGKPMCGGVSGARLKPIVPARMPVRQTLRPHV